MFHHCQALVIHCIDYRLQRGIFDYLQKNNLLGDCDIVSIAGGVKDTNFILTQAEVSKRLHNINTIILINHTDCGAYGGRAAFGSDQEERERHMKDMKAAGEMIKRKFPDLEIVTVLAKIPSSGEIAFEALNSLLWKNLKNREPGWLGVME